MHVMTGPEASRQMRKIGYMGPIIGVTGDADTEEFLASGADMVRQPLYFYLVLPSSMSSSSILLVTWLVL
jgi:CheY-like chemotaxis protein